MSVALFYNMPIAIIFFKDTWTCHLTSWNEYHILIYVALGPIKTWTHSFNCIHFHVNAIRSVVNYLVCFDWFRYSQGNQGSEVTSRWPRTRKFNRKQFSLVLTQVKAKNSCFCIRIKNIFRYLNFTNLLLLIYWQN